MINKNYLLALAVVGALATDDAHGAVNLASNGGFESGDFTGWTPSDLGASGVNTGQFAHDGSFGAALGTFQDIGSLSQDLATTPGQAYDLSFWLKSDGVTPNQFSVNWDYNLIFEQTDIPKSGWTFYKFRVTGSDDITTLNAYNFRNDYGFLALDGVFVTPVPEPATCFAGAFSLLCLGARMIRKHPKSLAA
jgi:hypothetical protein